MASNKVIKVRQISHSTSNAESGPGLVDKAVVPITGLVNGGGIAIRGEIMYVSDSTLNVIFVMRRGSAGSRVLAGAAGQSGSTDGQGSAARFNQPSDIVLDEAGNLYVVDKGNKLIRKVTENGNVYTVASISSSTPSDLAVDEVGNIYLLDIYP